MDVRKLDTKAKALSINLDKRTYGSLAEIGAGQEVAAQLFKAGAASQTIAKTISAYDMTFSDAIYGKEEKGRYVCEPRLMKMLDREYDLLESRLKDVRPSDNLFFAFSDTVVAINFAKTNQPHGWMGIRFQLNPGAPPNDIVVHIRMMEGEANAQQVSVGIFGINLIYGAFYHSHNPEELLQSLMDGLTVERIKIDTIRFSGPDFQHVNNRVMALRLVQYGYTNAVLFNEEGNVCEPADVFYKKNILLSRGRFRPVTKVNMDMFKRARKQFLEEPDVKEESLIEVAELTLNNLRSEGEIDFTDFLDRVDLLCSLGKNVLISNYPEYYRLVTFIARYTKQKFALVIGTYNLVDIFNEEFYTKLKGGILEAFGNLFNRNIKVYIYPVLRYEELYHLRNFVVPQQQHYLVEHLKVNQKLIDLKEYDRDILHIFSDHALAMIKKGEPGWETMVPYEVEQAIKSKRLFGYQG
ncbi:MAG: TonB-dependent receptor [Cytophagaceae bacterium]|jgi:hypothetical protein|nr:TonB-dependent receptor [Cytophagaceae bacterium]